MKWVVSLRVVTSSHCVLQCGGAVLLAVWRSVCVSPGCEVCRGPHYARAVASGARPVTRQQVTVYL